MTVHLLKYAVGVTDIAHLEALQSNRRAVLDDGREVVLGHTRRMPRRAAEVIEGGSLYWIVRGVIRVRQRVFGLAEAVDGEGLAYCQIQLDPVPMPTEAMSHRPIQGWRYLAPAAAPPDLHRAEDGGGELPPHLVRELRALGLW